MTSFKSYMETQKPVLPPNLEVGQTFARIDRIEDNTFNLDGNETKGMRIFTDKGEFKTSSGVIMDILHNAMRNNVLPLENVRVVQPRGKRYLTLEGF